MMDQESYLNELDRIPFPTIRYHYKVNSCHSVVNFFGLAMELFMMSAPMMGWIGYESPSLGTAYMFGGFCQYLCGFYDWYQGRTMLSFIDFVFGLLHFTFYYTADLGKYSLWVPDEYYTYMQGVFYCLWLSMLLVVMISLKGKGYDYLLTIFLHALASIFMIVWEFSNKTWARKTAGYITFINSIFIWVNGVDILIYNIFGNHLVSDAPPFW